MRGISRIKGVSELCNFRDGSSVIFVWKSPYRFKAYKASGLGTEPDDQMNAMTAEQADEVCNIFSVRQSLHGRRTA